MTGNMGINVPVAVIPEVFNGFAHILFDVSRVGLKFFCDLRIDQLCDACDRLVVFDGSKNPFDPKESAWNSPPAYDRANLF